MRWYLYIVINIKGVKLFNQWLIALYVSVTLICNRPPFTATDPMKVYNIILRGFDQLDFPRHLSRWNNSSSYLSYLLCRRNSVNLMKRFCKDNPTERLGYQKSGILDIKKQKWFQVKRETFLTINCQALVQFPSP